MGVCVWILSYNSSSLGSDIFLNHKAVDIDIFFFFRQMVKLLTDSSFVYETDDKAVDIHTIFVYETDNNAVDTATSFVFQTHDKAVDLHTNFVYQTDDEAVDIHASFV